jgi:hypothetical protein
MVVVGNDPTCGPNMAHDWTDAGTKPCADPGDGREGRDRETLALSAGRAGQAGAGGQSQNGDGAGIELPVHDQLVAAKRAGDRADGAFLAG